MVDCHSTSSMCFLHAFSIILSPLPGILHKSNTTVHKKKSAILILNIDILEEKNCTTDLYQWLAMRSEAKKNGRVSSTTNTYMLHDDVIVIAYVTHAR